MTITLKENINLNSLILKHEILLGATSLLVGREGVLETEKELRLMLAFVNRLSEEDIIEEVNNEEGDLNSIIEEKIEPFFLDLMNDEGYKNLYLECRRILFNRCDEIWRTQHSAMGVIEALLVAIGSLTSDETKEILEKTAGIASQAMDRRTEVMAEKTEAVNSKLQELMDKYREASIEEKRRQEEQKSEENSAG